MTQQKNANGLLWKQEQLSPLPIPTGQPPSDVLGMIWRKNEVYLDIGSVSLAGGWVACYLGTLIWTVALVQVLFNLGYLMFFMFLFSAVTMMGFLWYGYVRIYLRPLMPPLRFHRQRREVRIVTPESEEWTVPWERVHAIAPSTTMVGQFGAAKMGGLLLWFPYADQIDEPFHINKEGWAVMVSPGPGVAAMRQWECIRSFMEVGPEAVPEPAPIHNGHLSIWQSFVHDMREGVRTKGWLRTVAVDGFLSFLFNLFALDYLTRKKFVVIPDLTSSEAIAWSKPLPPEQWAKPSPELEEAIAERERDLEAAEARSKLKTGLTVKQPETQGWT